MDNTDKDIVDNSGDNPLFLFDDNGIANVILNDGRTVKVYAGSGYSENEREAIIYRKMGYLQGL